MKSSKWGVGLHAIDWLVARQLGKLKGGTCLKSYSQGGGSRGQGECGGAGVAGAVCQTVGCDCVRLCRW